MHRTQTITKLQQLSPVIITALAIVIITGVFTVLASRNRLTVNADTVTTLPIQQAGLGVPQAFLPIAAAYQPKPLTAETKIPILMYHYIRDYTNSNDQLGINLSVSPTTFEQQLEVIKQAGYTPITFRDLTADLPAKPIILTFDDGYADAYTAALPILKETHTTGVFYIVSGFLNKDQYLTDAQVKELDAAGMEIGAHTVDHHDLSAMNAAAQQRELQESKTTLEQLLGKAVTAFCYPAGKYNDTTVQLAKTIGYTTATTTKPGIATGGDVQHKPYDLVRIRVTGTTDILKALGEKR